MRISTCQEAISVLIPAGTEMQNIIRWALFPSPGRRGCFGWIWSTQHLVSCPQTAVLQSIFGNSTSRIILVGLDFKDSLTKGWISDPN